MSAVEWSARSVIDGGWVDLGGQWIGPTQSNILALAESVGIKHFDSYATGHTVVNYGGAVSTIDGFLPPADALPSVSSADVAEANRVWAHFRSLAATVNVERPWLTPDAPALDAQTVTSWGITATGLSLPVSPSTIGYSTKKAATQVRHRCCLR